MIDYSMFKCKLMEPTIGTGYTFSERNEFNGFFSDPLKWPEEYQKIERLVSQQIMNV